jgi:phage tail-like protein
MSCGGSITSFRLLDAFVGWDAQDSKGLTGLDDGAGLRLAQLSPGALDPKALDGLIPPPRLARGCGPCEWYLATPVPPAPRLLRFDKCTARWTPLWDASCAPDVLVEPVAVAAWKRRVAVSDRGAHAVFVWTRRGGRLAAVIKVEEPGPLAFTPFGELLVSSESKGVWRVRRFGPAGESRGELPELPAGRVERLAVSSDGTIWLVVENEGALKLWRLARPKAKKCDDAPQPKAHGKSEGNADEKNADEKDADEAAKSSDEEAKNANAGACEEEEGPGEFVPATPEDLRKALRPNGLTAVSELGFCLGLRGTDGLPVTCCYSWYGRPVCEEEIVAPPAPGFERQGQLLTVALDSGVPRCRWHRVRLDADVPQGTAVSVAVATSEEPEPASQGDPLKAKGWETFPAGRPHPLDWHQAEPGALDFLVRQPPGRYIFLRLRLTGDGTATPIVRRVRLDFPRSTSMELLPSVYRQSPEAEDFTERFISLFDSSLADLDRAIERYPALLDPAGVPEEILPWLGSFLDVTFDRAWGAEQRRQILAAIPELYGRRGTVAGIKQAVELIFGVEPTIQELAAGRMWGVLGRETRLGAVRLFGRSRARFRLGSSPFSAAPLRSFGNPNDDPLTEGAFRFRVLVPPLPQADAVWRERLARLVESQKPAHTIASVHIGGGGFVLGSWSAVGVDTALAPLAAPVLGKSGNVRLGRMSVLWPGPRGPRTGIIPGQTAVVGVRTVME